jgi:hypothetical protein
MVARRRKYQRTSGATIDTTAESAAENSVAYVVDHQHDNKLSDAYFGYSGSKPRSIRFLQGSASRTNNTSTAFTVLALGAIGGL